MINPQLPAATTGFGAALAQTLASLVAVCVIAWGLLRWASQRGLGGARTRNLEVLDRALLDARRAVFLVRAGKRVFLLGGGEQAVSVLAEIDPSELAAQSSESASPAGRAFAELLTRAKPKAPSDTL